MLSEEVVLGELDHGQDAFGELGLIKKQGRMTLYSQLENETRDFCIHVLEEPRE